MSGPIGCQSESIQPGTRSPGACVPGLLAEESAGDNLRAWHQCSAMKLKYENGMCRISVPEKHVWLDINEAYGGGFRRRSDVTARGYYEGGVNEGLEFGSEMNVGEITILLQQNWIEMSEILRTQDGPNHTAEPASLGRGGSS